jgi:hypothetical protein
MINKTLQHKLTESIVKIEEQLLKNTSINLFCNNELFKEITIYIKKLLIICLFLYSQIDKIENEINHP